MPDEPSATSSAAFRVRTGQGSTRLTREEFEKRYREQFADDLFAEAADAVTKVTGIAWRAYEASNKVVHTRQAGPDFADPTQELSVEWLRARKCIQDAQREFESAMGESRILLICASPRTDETCPAEMSKTFRLATLAREVIARGARFRGGFSGSELCGGGIREANLSLQGLRFDSDAPLPLALLLLSQSLHGTNRGLDE